LGKRKGRTWRNEGEDVLATMAGCAGRAPRCEGRRNETTWAIRARRQRAREGLEREEGEGMWSRARQGARRVSKRNVKTRRGGQGHGWGSRPNQTNEKQRVVAVVDETGWWVVMGGGGGWWWWVRGHVEGCARARKLD
jgi:hypothetical protein